MKGSRSRPAASILHCSAGNAIWMRKSGVSEYSTRNDALDAEPTSRHPCAADRERRDFLVATPAPRFATTLSPDCAICAVAARAIALQRCSWIRALATRHLRFSPRRLSAYRVQHARTVDVRRTGRTGTRCEKVYFFLLRLRGR